MITKMYLTIAAVAGLFLSMYAYMVEHKARTNTNYRPVCDINDKISCTKALGSEYGKILGVSNSFLGFFYYVTIAVLSYYSKFAWVFYLSLVSVAVSIYLAYILHRIKTFCIVCVSIYIVNIIITTLSYRLMGG